MAKIKPSQLTDDERRQLFAELERLFTSCRSADELRCLLRSLLSQDERVMLARRHQIATMLLDRRTYVKIASELGVGFDTIDRVRRWLEREGERYHRLMERSRVNTARTKRQIRRKLAPPFSLDSFRRRYPLDSWPLEAIDELSEQIKSYRRRHSRS